MATTAMHSPSALRVALVGNPNTGKTTLFNRLTGARQKIGNYPGVTVEKKSGLWDCGAQRIELVDLPGAYSLAATSPDERVSFDFLTGHLAGEPAPDAVVCVVDASNLVRNLFLASQVADLGLPLVIALNMSDAAEKAGIRVDAHLLSRHLGVPVIRTVATKGDGLEALEKAVVRAAGERACMAQVSWPEAVGRAVSFLRAGLAKEGMRPLADGELRRVLFDRQSAVLDRAGIPAGVDVAPLLSASRDILTAAGIQPLSAEALLRYEHIGHLTADTIQFPENRKRTPTERLDAVLTHRVWGLVIFVAMMFVVFQSIYTWAGPFMEWIEAGVALVQGLVAPLLAGRPALQSLVVDGVIGGVGGVVIFLPQILILFFFISLLEDTGYMARGAFLMDKMFGWCGLNGKSFVPMLSSYACAIPGVLAARTIEDPRARLTTILVSPLMSCSARLPVYVLMIGAFIEPAYGAGLAGFALFAMHFVGLAVAVPVAWAMNRFLLGTRPQPFLLEMPPYRVPRGRDILWRMWERAREFLVRAGTVIVAMTIIIWALVYFPRPENVREQIEAASAASAEETDRRVDAAYIEQSYLARAGRSVQPLFAPAGFDWKITVGVLASFPAREVIIATLGTIYGIGNEVDEDSGDLRKILASDTWSDGPRTGQQVFNVPVALAIMVFFALCLQCGATVAVMAKESNWGWAVFAFCYMTVLAWAGAVLTYQLGARFLAL
ncbi:MAG: ferrous iron transport protein B [Chthoniobacterales bacterium]|jgi:ferrous iron transport protein B